jgi:hypothetical protein
MVIVFGVKSSDLEEARAWVERATGFLAQARENDALGGDYYAFRGPLDEELALVENRDPYDGEPVFGFPSWDVLLRIQRIAQDSKALRGLENDPQHFEKLETRGV